MAQKDSSAQTQEREGPVFIKEVEVKRLLNWDDCVEAMEVTLVAATRGPEHVEDKSYTVQTPKVFTWLPHGNLFIAMPGYTANYQLKSITGEEIQTTLACKLATIFAGNQQLNPPLPSILCDIIVFDSKTGQMRAVIEATEITAWRTAAVSLVATKHLYYLHRKEDKANNCHLAICGAGTQGRIHAIAMLTYFPNFFNKISLWNRTRSRAEALKVELNQMFPDVSIEVFDKSHHCIGDADIIVTATGTQTPLFCQSDIKKPNVHICAIGASKEKCAEMDRSVYKAASSVFIESRVSCQTELKLIEMHVSGELGEVIDGHKEALPGQSIFQMTGNAILDCVMANLIYQKYIKS